MDKNLEKIIDFLNAKINYDYWDIHKNAPVNPTELLVKYMNKSNDIDIRPKDLYSGDGCVKYVSQGSSNFRVIYNMIKEALSKSPELLKLFKDQNYSIDICSRDDYNWNSYTLG